ncbi:MAG: M50 family metallopeptidase [Alphaproteobacteria bacterium]
MELLYIIPGFIVVLTIVVFFHELGHFSVARLFGVKIDTFSIGFGKEIFGWNDRSGTRWKVSWIPLGGYVKFWGDENAASLPDREALERMKAKAGDDYRKNFHFKPVWQRALIVAAGPIANFILAIVIFAVFFSVFGETLIRPRVAGVTPGSVAEAAGFQQDDIIRKAGGERIHSFTDLRRVVLLGVDLDMEFVVERDGKLVSLKATPERIERKDALGNSFEGGRLGIAPPGYRNPETGEEYPQREGDLITVRYAPHMAVLEGMERTKKIITTTFDYVGGMFAGRLDTDQLGGPLRIAQASGQAAQQGPLFLINFIALVSVSIGLINLMPIPVLDGGHLVYYGYEAAAGRPMSVRMQEFGFRIGLVAVLGLMIFATWNDLSNFGVFEAMRQFFQ